MNAKFLIELIQKADFLEQKHPNKIQSIEDFRMYLNEEFYETESPKNLSKKFDLHVYDLENEIAKQVILLGRYSKHLIKKAIDNHEGLSNDDFTYLFRLMDCESASKMQLIEKNAHEKQTGMEIIKRLIYNGLLSEKEHETDKRSKLVFVTEKGKMVFEKAMNDITKVSKIMCGTLANDDKQTLLNTLKTLNTFHHTIYKEKKQATLQEIEDFGSL